jgi:hypothetical protein
MYNVTLRRVQETTVVVEKQRLTYFCVCVCVCVCVFICVSARELACVCARVALLIQHAVRRNFAMCGFSGSTIFFDIVSYMARFSEKSYRT